MVLGVYYLTMLDDLAHKGDGRVFGDMDEVELAYSLDQIHIHAKIKLMTKNWYDEKSNRRKEPKTELIETTVGRVLFNRILPEDVLFNNEVLDKGGVKDLIAQVYDICGPEVTTLVADSVKDIGFEYAMRSGSTIAVADITIPAEKPEILAESTREVEGVTRSWRRGLLTEQERDDQIIEIWQQTTKKVAKAVRETMDPNGNLSTMANSGATKGGFGPISQLSWYAWING